MVILNKMKYDKVSGMVGTAVEFLKKGGEDRVEWLVRLIEVFVMCLRTGGVHVLCTCIKARGTKIYASVINISLLTVLYGCEK